MEEKYSFKNHFNIGDIIYYANVEESLVSKLRLRTIEDTYMVGVTSKSQAAFIGRGKLPKIFKTFIDAKHYLDSIGKSATLDIAYDIPDQLKEMEDNDE